MTIEQAQKKIRNAWIIGLISGFMTLLFTVAAATREGGTLDVSGTVLSLWNLLDVFLIFVFTFGIYMKSRVAAVGMVAYFLVRKLMSWAALPKLDIFVLIGMAFLYFYFEGARGAIAHHRLRQAHTPINPPVTSPGDR